MKSNFELDREEALSVLPEFADLYANRPVRDNSGGMGFNHSFATWFILRKLTPKFVIESGVWKGHSTWLIENACPGARVFCLDLNFAKLQYRSRQATYLERDFALCDWSGIDPEETVGFFDDHQNAYARLKDLYWVGIRHAIFEDNFPCGEGDCYSLRHAKAAFGHPHIQMSKDHLGGPRQQIARWLTEFILRRVGARQQVLIPANDADRQNLERRLIQYTEFPPVVKRATDNWGGGWTGPYESMEPLVTDSADILALESVIQGDDAAFAYCYLAYVHLK